MKKLITMLVFIPMITNAQISLLGGKNIIKTNLAGDVIGNYNLTYERSLAKKNSFSVGVRYMPKSTMPQIIKDKVEQLVDDKNIKINDFQMGNFAITPEFRIYLSAGKMKGFYLAPYARYASFDLQVQVAYNYSNAGTTVNASALFNGTFTSISAGLLIGSQFQIAKKLVLDVWIIGGHYGTSSGTISATDFNPAIDPTNTQQKQAFKDQVESVNNKDYGPFKFKGEVSSDYKTATFTTTGAWAGVRALGLNLGFRF
jgi:hypothetical protein